MEKRALTKLGIETSLLGFGCMRFPQDSNGKINESEAAAMMDKAYESGVNYFDTAYPYHDMESEPFVGKYLEKYERDSYFLATKMPCWLIKSREDAKEIFYKQLERLQKDYIDFYLLHALGDERWEEMVSLGIIELCEELQREGKIKYFGFSFHDSYEVFEKIITYREWDFCQIQLNYMDIDEQAGTKGYHLAEKLGVPIVIMEPVKGGSLADLPSDIKQILEKVDDKKSVASWAMRWIGSLPNVKAVLSGMSNMEQVEDNLNTFTDFKELNETEAAAIDAVREALSKRVRNGCTGCRYCMPCPANVDIPSNFKAWNTYNVYLNQAALNWKWKNEMQDENKAKQCMKCGKCEKECPQNIKIREDLETLQKELDQVCED